MIDLAEIIDSSISRQVKFDLSVIDMGKLTLLELLDACDAAGVDPADMGPVMDEGATQKRARLLYALAWVIIRRVEADLTFKEACTFDLDVIGVPGTHDEGRKRAKAVVAVAAISGVSTRDAEQMTMDEVAEFTDLAERRNRATRRRR